MMVKVLGSYMDNGKRVECFQIACGNTCGLAVLDAYRIIRENETDNYDDWRFEGLEF